MIWLCCLFLLCIIPHANRKPPTAPASASSRPSGRDQYPLWVIIGRPGVSARPTERPRRRDQREGDEREEPRQVEVDPVREHELEADDQRGGERREPQRRTVARPPRERDSGGDQQHLEPPL